MKIAVTGATGFVGRYIVRRLAEARHTCRCWNRRTSDLGGFEDVEDRIEWIEGDLCHRDACQKLVAGCDAIVHAALYHPGGGFQGGEGDILDFVQTNVVGTIELIQTAYDASVAPFVFISTCAVHDKILPDRPLDETHPLWPTSHYGAHKAAIEKFVHSYGFGKGYPICALRPTGVYGLARPASRSKWYDLVRRVVRGKPVECQGGGKEVHAGDVAQAVDLLLKSDRIAGEAYSCYDRYVSEREVADLAKRLSRSESRITGEVSQPKHQIVTEKIRALGMRFGGDALLEETVRELVEAARRE